MLSKNHRILAGCMSAFIGDGTHELDLYTVPAKRGQGLAQIAACHTIRDLMATQLPDRGCDSSAGVSAGEVNVGGSSAGSGSVGGGNIGALDSSSSSRSSSSSGGGVEGRSGIPYLNARAASSSRAVVNWSCDSGNVPSKKIAERLGFRYTGNVPCFEYAPGSRALSKPREEFAAFE